MPKIEVKIWSVSPRVQADHPIDLWITMTNMDTRPVRVLSLPPDGLGQNEHLPLKLRLIIATTGDTIPYKGPVYKVSVTSDNFIKLHTGHLVGIKLDLRQYYRINKGHYVVRCWYDTESALRRSWNWGLKSHSERLWKGRTDTAEMTVEVI